MQDLFSLAAEDTNQPPWERIAIGRQACVLRGFALRWEQALLSQVQAMAAQAPFRHLRTPGGRSMQVAMTNCGACGWYSDAQGYRYTATDPLSGQPWPPMPEAFAALAAQAAEAADLPPFAPNACLINRYTVGTRLTLHQDEGDAQHPIVSVSLGLPAVFLWGGDARADATQKLPLQHGDVVVWGGVDRMRYHGVMPVKDGTSPVAHPLLDGVRINLTFRRAG
ncbi:DNA oxidative demethylase AlkB [Comamonas piscis]|uniref:DNA oxidative demethylase AlkB n=1 Tax=Comamonas piscis TaxID=1562974 RepID=A0A7G5EEY7_9BURK|nr:DNA oxidative demethylase AlkB [Comamonas piscis]QMV72562.1 DNA oxidative demethylase AlkB [Comamonas piscis]WSO35332.1 DNA oxidative demethylase AlkB [Comamonas piscis]